MSPGKSAEICSRSSSPGEGADVKCGVRLRSGTARFGKPRQKRSGKMRRSEPGRRQRPDTARFEKPPSKTIRKNAPKRTRTKAATRYGTIRKAAVNHDTGEEAEAHPGRTPRSATNRLGYCRSSVLPAAIRSGTPYSATAASEVPIAGSGSHASARSVAAKSSNQSRPMQCSQIKR